MMLTTLQDHPVLIWIGAIVTTISTVTAAAGIWWYIQDERERSLDHSNYLTEVRREQEAIRKELATQSQQNSRIEREQKAIQTFLTQRFDAAEAGRRWLASEIHQVTSTVSLELGRLLSMHDLQQPNGTYSDNLTPIIV